MIDLSKFTIFNIYCPIRWYVSIASITIIVENNAPQSIDVPQRDVTQGYSITFNMGEYFFEDYDSDDEKNEVLKEAREILDVNDVIASIILVENLRIQKD